MPRIAHCAIAGAVVSWGRSEERARAPRRSAVRTTRNTGGRPVARRAGEPFAGPRRQPRRLAIPEEAPTSGIALYRPPLLGLFLALDLGPRVAQGHRAVEDRRAGSRVDRVDAEVAVALELPVRAGRRVGQARL